MDEWQREQEQGLDWEYMIDALPRMEEVGDKYKTPGFGLAAQLFACTARGIIERLGAKEAEILLKKSIETFGFERGKRVAQRVRDQGLPLSLKNWLIYGDIDSDRNFKNEPDIVDGDLVVKVNECTFFQAAEEWGLGQYAHIYCKYVDYCILKGYNPEIVMTLEERQRTGKDYCLFRYKVKK